jgi:hypothetical protein
VKPDFDAFAGPAAGFLALIKPTHETHELYGEILLFLDRPQEAQHQFERALLWIPQNSICTFFKGLGSMPGIPITRCKTIQ